MADSVGGGMMTGDHFSNSLYKGKMAQKWPKIWTYDAFIVFIKSQDFGKFRLFLADFWPKNPIFFNFRVFRLKKKFRRKMYLVLGKSSNWPKNGYTCTLLPLLELLNPFFGYFVFLPFYGSQSTQKGLFMAQNTEN